MAAVLTCGPSAVLSHQSAGALWGIHKALSGLVHVSVAENCVRRRAGIRVHRRSSLARDEIATTRSIPCTDPATTVVDLAPSATRTQLQRVINEADKRDLIDPNALRKRLDQLSPRPGLAIVRQLLDRHTFVLTDSELEDLFLPIAYRASLARPETDAILNGFEVDFFWPELGLVVETDGLRYHRTQSSRSETAYAIKRTLRPASRPCVSLITRSSTRPTTLSQSCAPSLTA